MIFVSVNAWVKRFLTEGINSLKTRADRGRKPIMDRSDEQAYERNAHGESPRHSKESNVLACTMPTKVIFVLKDMFPTIGSFRVRVYTLHPCKVHE